MTRLDTIDGAGRPLRRFADNYTMVWRLVHALAAVYYCTVYDLWRSDDDGVLSATTSVSDLKRRRYTHTHTGTTRTQHTRTKRFSDSFVRPALAGGGLTKRIIFCQPTRAHINVQTQSRSR